MGRALASIGLIVGLCGLVGQFAWSVPAYLSAGRSLPGAVVAVLGYFTILTNIAVILAYLAALTGRPRFFRQAGVRAGLAMAIAVVAIVYHFVLARLWQPAGLLLFADTVLHYAAPAIYLVWWALSGRGGSARPADLPYWLVYPLAYLFCALAHGGVTGQYPYPFLDLAANGPASVAISVGIMLTLFAVVGLLVIWADRLLPAPRPSED